ncbi:hypothetical protein K458DRAFT_413377 [Lentithecium fluviatile CBS 122367]|uniref:Helicase C-terminal domain-containing protein n=1 Tax=Lentithecium fluviatile CBS 122367 TaxID=1168545 RepID=A0A6G1JFW3_9PLEO|nr:hypothetical protein K458DRAFT_413377 [Lentithecium fluviatile CBS 122367]
MAVSGDGGRRRAVGGGPSYLVSSAAGPSSQQTSDWNLDIGSSTSNLASSSTTPISTPMTSTPSQLFGLDAKIRDLKQYIGDSGRRRAAGAGGGLTSASSHLSDIDAKIQDLKQYIALGCLHFDRLLPMNVSKSSESDSRCESENAWAELLHSDLPPEVKEMIGNEATRLLDARWIRLFLHPHLSEDQNRSIVRVYLLPGDWARRFIDRNSKSLKSALRQLLQQLDISPEAWAGDYSEAQIKHFDPWASAENVSLFYLFNKLPSPDPAPQCVKNRFSRRAIEDLLDSTTPLLPEEFEQPLEGLRTRLYPYQARSTSLMVQREAAPILQLDPRLEVRQSPNGEQFFFGPRDGSFLREPIFYEANRGGILAETMGLGKTIICLSVILATRGHLPRIPATYLPPPRVRDRVGSLKEMAASIMGRHAIPAKDALERYEKYEDIDLSRLKHVLAQNIAYYEIPPDLPRMNRNTRIPPPQQLVTCSGTIVVVPRNLLHQWQSEIRKHLVKGSLKVLVVDTPTKRGKSKPAKAEDDQMDFRSDLPAPTELMEYDVLLITRNRFEQEIQDGADEKGRRSFAGAQRTCYCPYIGSSRIPDCSCKGNVYESPLKKIHWLRIIIDEGHSFSSSVSNAVLVAKQLQAERRWVVSGTPAKNLVGVEVDLSTMDEEIDDPTMVRELAIEQRKAFSLDYENTKAAKALGLLASNFLMVRPWSESTAEGRLDWEDYIYRHEHQYQKTYSGFSSCFLRTLEGLVVKTRPDDVEKDITLPPMRHRVVYIKPCWFDKMTANLFIQVLRANAITSERSDVDYLFHKNSVKARHSLIKNLRQSNFTWTGFSLEDVISTLETSSKYLEKGDKRCSLDDANQLLESSRIVSTLTKSESWIALSEAHEVGMAIDAWPDESEESFSLAYPQKPAIIGITQLLEGQLHVDSHILSGVPSQGLDTVGRVARAKIAAMAEAENETSDAQLQKVGVPSSCVGSQPLTSRRALAMTTKSSPQKKALKAPAQKPTSSVTKNESMVPADTIKIVKTQSVASPAKPKKRKLTLSDELAELPPDSPLRHTRVVGTTSAKLSYLIGKVVNYQATEKIIIFYDGDNAAFYIAQCLEMLYVNHRIYARTLDNTKRSEYVALFNEDPDIRVLLIDVACGALGLNLNAASVVLIVNPINRPGIEAQAIKRAHRIGQTKEVLVETLVLEGTIEEAIFKRAKKMSRQQHLEAKELEDDAGIIDIIQNARVLPIEPGEDEGAAKFAPLEVPQRVFGRPDRHRYHRFGVVEVKEKARKKAKTATSARQSVKIGVGGGMSDDGVSGMPSEGLTPTTTGNPVLQTQPSSIFGMGGRNGGSLFG